MNQRAGKTHRAALGSGMQEMHLRNFFRSCKELLEDAGEPHSLAAYYFEQLQEHLWMVVHCLRISVIFNVFWGCDATTNRA